MAMMARPATVLKHVDILPDEQPQGRGRGAEQDKDGREAGHEQKRRQNGTAAHAPIVPGLQLVEADAGEERQIGRDQRQHARADEADQPAERRRGKGNLEHGAL